MFHDFSRREILDVVRLWITQWLEQTRRVTLHSYRCARAERAKIAG